MSSLSDPPGRADRRRNDDKILLAAARVLAQDVNASMQAVADEAGLARLTVYRRYPTREALIAAVGVAVDVEANALLEAFPGWDEGESAFRWLVQGLAGVARRYPSVVRHGLGEEPERAERFDQRLAALLGRGQEAGVLRPDLDPTLLGVVLFGALRSVTTAYADPEQERAETAFADLMLTGVVAPPVA